MDVFLGYSSCLSLRQGLSLELSSLASQVVLAHNSIFLNARIASQLPCIPGIYAGLN